MKEIKLDKVQGDILNKAINLQRHLYDFDIDDEEFESDYGFSKEDILEGFSQLRGQLNG